MLSKEVETAVEKALAIAKKQRHEFATVEHLCFALFDDAKIKSVLELIGVSKIELKQRFLDYIEHQIETMPETTNLETIPSIGFQRVLQRAAIHVIGAGKELVRVEHVLVAAFDEDESYAVYLMQQSGITRLDLVSVISHGNLAIDNEDEEEDQLDIENSEEPQKQSVLSRYTICLTDQAKRNELDLIIGREKELNRALQVLSRRKKNNPLFVGEPGVGKTALAEGLAIKIINSEVPDYLLGSDMYLLDMGSMLAGARYRGDFENRMKSVIKALEAKKNAILVIDEIHTVIGAGSTAGSSMDASNLLKPILAKGHLRCIGSTTFKEYRTYFEKDRALARRFQKIDIEEPSQEDCIKIIEGLKNRYEEFHGVSIDKEAVSLAVHLAARYLHDRKLPDKAIDLIDEASARVRLSFNLAEKGEIIEKRVTREAIEEAVASMAHIPSPKVSADDKKTLLSLEQNLKNSVFGQDNAIAELSAAILLARAGLREKEKPIGCFLFTGPSGVGKTEVAKRLAENLGVSMLRFDMSEYMERHTASRLVGAPPGYVGYDEGGLLTDAINKSPHSVLLLDEIEKAHPDVFNMLLQVMDYGKLTDSNGRASDFRHCILIMTSNVGTRENEQRSIGFLEANNQSLDDKPLKRLFSPEFRNRLDARIAFNKLGRNIVIKVVEKFIDELRLQLKEKNISISISNDASEHLAHIGYDEAMGARPLARIIQEKIKKPLAKEILFGKLNQGGKVDISLKDTELYLDYREQS